MVIQNDFEDIHPTEANTTSYYTNALENIDFKFI